MRTGTLSEVIADLQMIHSRFGDLKVIVAVRNGDSIGMIPFGGLSVITLEGGKFDGMDVVMLFDIDLKPAIIRQAKMQEGEVVE